MDSINVQKYECLRIDYDAYSLLYYKDIKILNIRYFDEVDDDEVEITLWSEEHGFEDVDLAFIKKETILNALDYMRSYQ